VLAKDDLVGNFANHLVTSPLFTDVRRVNELFGFGKARPISTNTDATASTKFNLPTTTTNAFTTFKQRD
jgi:hypothetical protein